MTDWPNSVLQLAKAIKVAENSPPEWNNPGSMTFAGSYPTCGVANSEGVLKFLNAEDGWNALCYQISIMFNGKSKEYKTTDTLEQVGLKWSNKNVNWAKNVAEFLGVSTTITLAQLAAG